MIAVALQQRTKHGIEERLPLPRPVVSRSAAHLHAAYGARGRAPEEIEQHEHHPDVVALGDVEGDVHIAEDDRSALRAPAPAEADTCTAVAQEEPANVIDAGRGQPCECAVQLPVRRVLPDTAVRAPSIGTEVDAIMHPRRFAPTVNDGCEFASDGVLMQDRSVRALGLGLTLVYAAFIVFLYVTQPQNLAQVTGSLSSTVGAYRIDQQAFAEGLALFRQDRHDAARAAFARADPADRDPRTQFYIAYSYYRSGWGRFYSDDEDFARGLEHIDQAIALARGRSSSRTPRTDP
jgi:tetratricopeptide (TPR) repeat protein